MRKFLITMMCVIMVVCFMPTVALADGESGGASGLVSIRSLNADSETKTYDKDDTNSAHLQYTYYNDKHCYGINDTSNVPNLPWVKTVTITGINFGELTDSSEDMTALGKAIINGRRTDNSDQFKDSIEVKFINCTFNQEKAHLQVYKIMPCNVTKYTFENCTFNQAESGQFAITLNVAETPFDSRAISYEIINSSINSSGRGINITPGTGNPEDLGSYNNPNVLIKNNTIKTGTNQEKHVAVQISGDWNSANLTADSKPLITISENNITAYAAVRIHSTMSGQGAKYVALLANNTLTAGTRTVVADGNNELTKEIAAHYNTVLGGSISEYYAASITVDGNTAYYDTLADAIANAVNGNTVTLLNDVELTKKMTINESITIDGKGHTISAADGFTQDHLMLLQSNVTMKNVTLDSNGKAKGINTYGNDKSLKISFENVKMLKSLGNGLTAKGGTITLKNVEISGSGWKQSVDISASNDYNNGADLVVDRYCSFGDQGAVVFDNPGTGTKVGTVTSSDPSGLIVSSADETKDWASGSKPYTKRVFTLTKVSTGGITTPPTTQTDNVTNSGSAAADNATTSADLSNTTSTSNGTTVATVDKTTADKIVDKAVENKSTEVVIDATANSTAAADSTTTAQVTIPTETLGAIAEKTEADVTIKTDVAEVKMDNAAAAAVSEQAEGDTVKIIAEKVKEDATEVHFELKVVCSDGKVISDFKGGNIAVTVALPKAMAEKKVVCVYIDDNGHMSKVEGQKNADGTYTFFTGHFSTYAILAEEEADAAIAEQTEAIKNIEIKVSTKLDATKAGKKGIKVTWKTADGKKLDGVEFFRSVKKNSGYGKKAFFTSKKAGTTGYYLNTKSLKKGTRYYYRVRGYVLVDGQKVYTDWSNKGIRTFK